MNPLERPDSYRPFCTLGRNISCEHLYPSPFLFISYKKRLSQQLRAIREPNHCKIRATFIFFYSRLCVCFPHGKRQLFGPAIYTWQKNVRYFIFYKDELYVSLYHWDDCFLQYQCHFNKKSVWFRIYFLCWKLRSIYLLKWNITWKTWHLVIFYKQGNSYETNQNLWFLFKQINTIKTNSQIRQFCLDLFWVFHNKIGGRITDRAE